MNQIVCVKVRINAINFQKIATIKVYKTSLEYASMQTLPISFSFFFLARMFTYVY